MKGKAVEQLLILVAIFGALWFGLSKIDYVKLLNLEKTGQQTEKVLGNMIIKTLEQTEVPVKNPAAQKVLDNIASKLCNKAPNSPGVVTVHLFKNKQVNAFALPGNHLVVYTGLINHCDSAEELCGVMGHEIGHLALNHVMKRVGSEIGLTVLASVLTSGGAETVSAVLKMLSSRAFERGQEAEADAFSVKTMNKSEMNAEAFAGFMEKVAELQGDVPEVLEWVNTHPDSKKRAATIRSMSAKTIRYSKPVNNEDWEKLKNAAEY